MVQLHVTGMTCGGCARSVTNAVKKVDAHARVDINLASKIVAIESVAGAQAFAEAIRAAGYTVEEPSG